MKDKSPNKNLNSVILIIHLVLRKYDSEFNENEYENIFRAVDVNQNGLIEFSEFTIAIIKKKTIITKPNLKKIYAILNRV